MNQYKIADLHCDTIGAITVKPEIIRSNPGGHIDLRRLKLGNVAAQVFACFVSSEIPEKSAAQTALNMLEYINTICRENDTELYRLTKSGQMENKNDRMKTGIMPAIENGHAIGNNLSNLEEFGRHGVRYITITHSKNLDWAASSADKKPEFDGLTKFGEKVIASMNEKSIIADVSHVSSATLKKIIKISSKPVIASHSCVHNLCPIPRNLQDDEIKMIADSGGMIGINFFPAFLNINYYQTFVEKCGNIYESIDRIEKQYFDQPEIKFKESEKLYKTISDIMSEFSIGYSEIIKHIKYIIDLVGDDFVGFGSDFDGIPDLPQGISGSDSYGILIEKMRQSGFSENSIQKITYKNFFRVFK